MTEETSDVWTDFRSVLFTSLYGWTPDTWGCIGWSNNEGRSHRDKLLKELSDPFICVCYVTGKGNGRETEMEGMIGGFYLVSHVIGDRDEFTHPIHHTERPESWRHSLQAIRAFSYVPEYRCRARVLFPKLLGNGSARSVARWGKEIDGAEIEKLRDIPWVEVPVFSSGTNRQRPNELDDASAGMVQAGPASGSGYVVSGGTRELPRELYVLRLSGDIEAYLGRSPEGASIYKIGLSFSPELRRMSLQKSMPEGAFKWKVVRTTQKDGDCRYSSFSAALAGENAMKQHLASNSEWLGGEFYLASREVVADAWKLGRQAASDFDRTGVSGAE